MNIDKLKGLMVEKKITRENLAEYLNCSKSTIDNKLQGVTEFDVKEFKQIATLLQLNEEETIKLLMS